MNTCVVRVSGVAMLDRLLANLGYGSRREIQMLARAGAVVLDGTPLRDADQRIALGDVAGTGEIGAERIRISLCGLLRGWDRIGISRHRRVSSKRTVGINEDSTTGSSIQRKANTHNIVGARRSSLRQFTGGCSG